VVIDWQGFVDYAKRLRGDPSTIASTRPVSAGEPEPYDADYFGGDEWASSFPNRSR
jgi:hypothetical protein